MTFDNKTYDKLKWIAQYMLPAIGTLYFALARIWGLPYASEVVGTITAVDTFLGVLLGISSANYEGDGNILVNAQDEDGVCLEFDRDPNEMVDGEKVTLRIKK